MDMRHDFDIAIGDVQPADFPFVKEGEAFPRRVEDSRSLLALTPERRAELKANRRRVPFWKKLI